MTMSFVQKVKTQQQQEQNTGDSHRSLLRYLYTTEASERMESSQAF